jgi:hypothetical protein
LPHPLYEEFFPHPQQQQNSDQIVEIDIGYGGRETQNAHGGAKHHSIGSPLGHGPGFEYQPEEDFHRFLASL